MILAERFAVWAKANNWQIKFAEEKSELPEEITQRYTIPSDWLEFIKHFSLCSNVSDTKWFLTIEDYFPKKEGFQWNEFELQSLEAAESDPKCAEQWKEQVQTYWNTYFPIVMNVEGEYTYFAIDTDTGEVVSGCEPEYEECDVAADSFCAFLERIMKGELL